MKTCIIQDYNWNREILHYFIQDDNGGETIFSHMVFMWYTKKEAIKLLKTKIRERYGDDIKFKIESAKNTDENIVKTYDLQPINSEKSFYGKAKVHIYKNGDEVLQSYETLIIRRKKSGKLIRLWDEWSATTGRHIKAFCGLNKAEFIKLPLGK